MATASDLIWGHPTNPVDNKNKDTHSSKVWAEKYNSIQNLRIHTRRGVDGLIHADFDTAFLPEYDDDALRLGAPAVGPNARSWSLESEADCELWFHTEVSNVVLAAWNDFCLVTQTSHTKPPQTDSIREEVDVTYTMQYGEAYPMVVIAIGETKRNLIHGGVWQSGNLSINQEQLRLSRELRGYAHNYQCPQVYCFDGNALLLLQFRVRKLEKIKDADCPVDCWVFHRLRTAVPLRYALYRLLAQGFRRYQSTFALPDPLTVGSLMSQSRAFFDGRPIWEVDGTKLINHPEGYQRSVDANSGAILWTHPDHPEEAPVRETHMLWGQPAQT